MKGRNCQLLSARMAVTAAGTALAILASGCGAGNQRDINTIEYWLWDTAQQPAYTACAQLFEEQNPELNVEIRQFGWNDYWTQLTTGMVSERAPDVFTNHLQKYYDYASRGQLLALDEFIERDGVDIGIYQEGLAELWVGQDNSRYGLPKDWDTTAIFYNKEMVAEAGITEDDMQNLTWNPEDGGTYEDVIARLTVDANGVRGDEPGFNPRRVAVYGLGLEHSGDSSGQGRSYGCQAV